MAFYLFYQIFLFKHKLINKVSFNTQCVSPLKVYPKSELYSSSFRSIFFILFDDFFNHTYKISTPITDFNELITLISCSIINIYHLQIIFNPLIYSSSCSKSFASNISYLLLGQHILAITCKIIFKMYEKYQSSHAK